MIYEFFCKECSACPIHGSDCPIIYHQHRIEQHFAMDCRPEFIDCPGCGASAEYVPSLPGMQPDPFWSGNSSMQKALEEQGIKTSSRKDAYRMMNAAGLIPYDDGISKDAKYYRQNVLEKQQRESEVAVKKCIADAEKEVYEDSKITLST